MSEIYEVLARRGRAEARTCRDFSIATLEESPLHKMRSIIQRLTDIDEAPNPKANFGDFNQLRIAYHEANKLKALLKRNGDW